MTKKPTKPDNKLDTHYDSILGDISNIIDAARKSAARSINSIKFYLLWPTERIFQTPSEKSQDLPEPQEYHTILQTLSEKSQESSTEVVLHSAAELFPLPWSAYVRLLSVKNKQARKFYETETLRGGCA